MNFYLKKTTEYVNYALVYSCDQYNFLDTKIKSEAVWIISRQKQQINC